MLKLNSKLLGGAGAALMVAAFAAPAQAQTTPLYSDSGTLAEKVYRDIFNCYGNQSGGEQKYRNQRPLAVANSLVAAPAQPYWLNI